MNNKKKDLFLYLITIILSLIILLTVIHFLKIGKPLVLLWFCYIGIIIIIIGIIKRNSNLVLSQILILNIPILLWIIDFIVFIIAGTSPLGITNVYFFDHELILERVISLQHIIVLPLSIWALSLIKLNKNHYKALLISFSEVVLLFILGLLISNPFLNINCLAKNCTQTILPSFIPYYVIWGGFMIISILISYFIITSLPFVKKNSHSL